MPDYLMIAALLCIQGLNFHTLYISISIQKLNGLSVWPQQNEDGREEKQINDPLRCW